ncbi:MAG: hypothetical protein IKQ77_13205 [Prevotella sp.]|nr:hypothetical protein [Prevotella sp.]
MSSLDWPLLTGSTEDNSFEEEQPTTKAANTLKEKRVKQRENISKNFIGLLSRKMEAKEAYPLPAPPSLLQKCKEILNSSRVFP